MAPQVVNGWLKRRINDEGWHAHDIAELLNIDTEALADMAAKSRTQVTLKIAKRGLDAIVSGEQHSHRGPIEELIDGIGISYMGGFLEGWIARSGEFPILPSAPHHKEQEQE